MESSLFSEKNQKFYIQLNNIAIPLIGHHVKTHKPVEIKDPKTKEIKKMCTKYWGISCEDHKAIYNELAGKLGISGTPSTFILNPDLSVGKQLEAGEQFNEKATIDAIMGVQKSLGRGLVGESWISVQKYQKEADESIEKEKYDKAISALKSIKSMGKKTPDAYIQFVDEKLGEINQKGEELLDQALGSEDVKVREKAIKGVMDKFKGLDVEKKAKEELDKLKEGK